MNKELQDLAWSLLPKEFKEEVKRIYNREMASYDYEAGVITDTLEELFGSKCLSDDSKEPKPVSKMKPIESKVSVYLATKEEDEAFRTLLHENGFKWNGGDSLKDCSCWSEGCELRNIHCLYPGGFVTHSGRTALAPLTFSEFKKRYFAENVNLSQSSSNLDKQFDNILKDSFRKERRLNIAAMAIASIMGSSDWSNYRGATDEDVWRNMAKASLGVADALISEAEKGRSDGN